MSTKLPSALAEHTGRVLARLDVASGATISSPLLSVWGTHMLVLTDAPGVLLHDTGGLGAEVARIVEPIAEENLELQLESNGAVLRGQADLGDGWVVDFSTSREIGKILAGLLPSRRRLPDARFDSVLALEVEAWTVGAESADTHALRVTVIGDRLKLLSEGEPVADLPARFVEHKRSAPRRIEVTTRTTLADEVVARLTIHFPAAGMAKQLEQVLASAAEGGEQRDPGPPHVTSVVHIGGRTTGAQSADGDADLLLGERSLELREMGSGRILCRFDLAASATSRTRAAGTIQEFLLWDATQGPVRVSGGAESFRQSLAHHAAFQALAKRSLEGAPFLLYVNGHPAALSIAATGLRIAGKGVDRSVAFDAIAALRTELREGETQLRIQLQGEALEVAGQREVLQAFHAALLLERIERSGESSEALAKAILGLEGEYLSYAIFGRFLELDALLRQKCPGSEVRIALPEGSEPEPLLQLSALMIQGSAALIRHLHLVQSYLPVSLAERDGALCAGLGADAPDFLIRKQQERELRRALAPIAGLRAELERIHGLLVSRTGLDAAALTAEDDYGGLAISLVGAVINPIFLLGSAQQLYSTYQRGTHGETSRREGTRAALGYALERWSELLRETVPLLAYHTLEDLFPSRLQLVKRLLGAAQKDPDHAAPLRRRLARRRATLEARLAHRSEGSSATRHAIAAQLRAARDQIHCPDLQVY